jgi:hypothetical protein
MTNDFPDFEEANATLDEAHEKYLFEQEYNEYLDKEYEKHLEDMELYSQQQEWPEDY